MGVFSLDSPIRPNPIGLSLVSLLRRQGKKSSSLGWTTSTAPLSWTSNRTSPTIASKSTELPEWLTKLMEKADYDWLLCPFASCPSPT